MSALKTLEEVARGICEALHGPASRVCDCYELTAAIRSDRLAVLDAVIADARAMIASDGPPGAMFDFGHLEGLKHFEEHLCVLRREIEGS